jgi:uncharacterized protein YbjT (DUF2867 family)/uncharacterized protein YndB with AHSA1/START domain
MKVLVTGATGYIGGRLVPRLLERGHDVRVLVRDRRRLVERPWASSVDIRVGDLLDASSLDALREEIHVALYLVHSMDAGAQFEARDRTAAENFVEALSPGTRVVYLGGLLPPESASGHLRSRGEVGEILRRNTAALELRAGPIIGSGSASFEMVRYLTERLPVMVAPRWIRNQVQPIGVEDVLSYLIASVELDETGVVEIGSDRLSFRQMMMVYAGVRGLRRTILPVPLLVPKLAALWVGLVTPIPNRLAVPLIGGIVSTPVADTERARELFPRIEPLSYEESVRRATDETSRGEAETSWSGALGANITYELADREGLIRETRTMVVDASPSAVYRAFSGLGGMRGWLVWDLAWRIRGALDKLAGGPGLRRGRRHPDELYVGEAVDFWRVEAAERDHLLRLRAEMKLPGRAWLQWTVTEEGSGSRLIQTATFSPRGLSGAAYWYALYPFHRLIFSDLIRAVAKRASATG